MKNLVIHPEDKSTAFLKPIYKSVENKTVIEKDAFVTDVMELIKKSDRIFMMGHGCPFGLFSIRLFAKSMRSVVVRADETELLRDKLENIYVWCHANRFVEENDLHGFYSGMFISEVAEAFFCDIREATQEMVDESNNTFSEIVGKYIHLPKDELYEKVMEEYGEIAKTNPVAKYNHDRLFVR